jgi:hypothetical protein
MSADEMREAIHFARGWKKQKSQNPDFKWVWTKGDSYEFAMPNYAQSRDSAISAVVELCGSGMLKMKFIHRLRDELGTYTRNLSPSGELFEMLTATPEQICTALVKALNLDQKGAQG